MRPDKRTTILTGACRAIVAACPTFVAFGRRSVGRIGWPSARPAPWIRACLLILIVGVLLAFSSTRGHAAGIECPEAGADGVPNLLGSEPQFKLGSAEDNVDLANEIEYLINKLQIEKPNISSAELTNVAQIPRLTAAEKWHRLRQFDVIVQRQVAANITAPGTLIIANVPLSPAVFRELGSRQLPSIKTPRSSWRPSWLELRDANGERRPV